MHCTYTRLLWTILTVLGGVAGVRWGRAQESLWAIYGTLAVCSLCAALVLGLPSGPSVPPRELRIPAQRSFRVALAGLALALTASQLLFVSGSPGWGWLAYLASLACLALLARSWSGGGEDDAGADVLGSWEMIAVPILLALGACFRFYSLEQFPHGTWFDEAQNTLITRAIIADSAYRPVFVPGLSQMPALTFYYYVPFERLFSSVAAQVYVLPVRLGSAVAGTLALLATWLCARELFGRRVGIAALGLMAMLRWHVTFSRFGMSIVFPTIFFPLVVALLERSLARGSGRHAIWCGIAIGLGMQFYYSMLMAPLLVIAILAHRCVFAPRLGRKALAPLFLITAAALVAYSPVLQYALRDWGSFSERLSAASIFSEYAASARMPGKDPVELSSSDKLKRSLIKHAGMFHLKGDTNGRHNLRAAPMLDDLCGVLFAIGLGWSLWLFKHPRFGLLILWFLAHFSSGVMSIAWEAPQAARTLGLTCLIPIIVALPIDRAVRQAGGLLARGLVALAVGAGAAFSLAENWQTFFHSQRYSEFSWAGYSSAETKIAELARDEGGRADIYVHPRTRSGPVEMLVAGHVLDEVRSFSGLQDLPLSSRGRSAIVIVNANETQSLNALRRLYPNLSYEPFGPIDELGRVAPVLYQIVRIPEGDLSRIYRIRTGILSASGARSELITPSTIWEWEIVGQEPPFTAVSEGILTIESAGQYELSLESDPKAELEIDSWPVLKSEGGVSGEIALSLLPGAHKLRLVVDLEHRAGRTELRWRAPSSSRLEPMAPGALSFPEAPGGGLVAEYFGSNGLQAQPEMSKLEPHVAYYYHVLPLARPFSIRWRGEIHVPTAGSYAFGGKAVDSLRVLIDGSQVYASSKPGEWLGSCGGGEGEEGAVQLSAGWHAIEVQYSARSNYSQVYLCWRPPGADFALVPSSSLRPPPFALSSAR